MKAGELDPVTLEVYWNRLVTIMYETDMALLRTAFSTSIGESRDFAFLLLDQAVAGLAQSTWGLPVFTGILPYTTRSLLQSYPPETLQDGDVLLTNDPWLGAGHLPDYCFAKPIFHRHRLIGYVACLAHMADSGGSLSYFGARDVFEEGLTVPPCKVMRIGVPNDDVMDIVRANTRVPEMVVGDIRAVWAALHVATERVCEFLNEYGLTDLQTVSDSIQARSEDGMRRAISAIPSGTYRYSLTIESYAGEQAIIAATIRVAHDALDVDFTGSSEETYRGAVNVCLNYTRGSAWVALKSALVPEIPNNEGLFRPVKLIVPGGTILNCRRPAPVKGRSVVAVHAVDAMFGALATVIPQKVQAGSGGFWGISASGRYEDGRPFAADIRPHGGIGGSGRKDGLAATAFPWNAVVTPSEVFESHVPLFVECKELVTSSGGDGRFRGGLGQRLAFRPQTHIPVRITLRSTNLRVPPQGLLGGTPGSLGRVLLNGRECRDTVVELRAGDELVCEIAGGGGFGQPNTRDDGLRKRDTALGYTQSS